MKHRIPFPQRLAGVVGAVALLVLAACGGGGAGGDTASTATPQVASRAVSGTITGFGSVIIDGVKFDDSATRVSIDADPSAPSQGTLGDLKLGMRVEGQIVDGQLHDVVVHAALFGPVAGLDAPNASFSIYGQTVKVVSGGATPTVFEGVQDFAGLQAGDVVEVHGTLDATKALNATRIERKPQGDLAKGIRLGGVLATLDADAHTFKLNDLTVDYTNATLLPAGTALAAGQLVMVFGDTPPAAGRFAAKAVKVAKAQDGSEFAIGGRIMAFSSLADFTVSGVRIDAHAAAIEGGVAGDLAAGIIVGAEGSVVDGVLQAKKLRILKTPADVKASLKGQVGDWVSASSFRVRGAPVDASAAEYVGGSAADLGAGAWVLVEGHVQGDVLKAERITFIAPPAAQALKLMGEVRDWNADARGFHFLGVSLHLADDVQFEGGTLADMLNGKRVEVTGTPDAQGVVQVKKLAFLGELAPPVAVVGGRLFDRVDGGFKLPGMAVHFDANTVFDGGSATDLANGVLVMAKGRFNPVSHAVDANWIEIVKADANAPRVAGTISAFSTPAELRVGTQLIDASQAVFTDGSAADLAVGAVIEAVGTLRDAAGQRVLVATKLRFLSK